MSNTPWVLEGQEYEYHGAKLGDQLLMKFSVRSSIESAMLITVRGMDLDLGLSLG